MERAMKKIAELILPLWAMFRMLSTGKVYRALRPIAKRKCNICGYSGYFGFVGRPARLDAKCPKCHSFERHRLMMLGIDRNQIPLNDSQSLNVIHFAAEPILEKIFRKKWPEYRTADLYKKADLKLNLENIELPDASVDLIIANHVLEHVDDHKAGTELSRILTEKGIFLCMVPIVEGWETTYENDQVHSEEERWLHFGQGDHLRFYGRDFRQRIERGGFKLINEITAEGEDVVKHGLLRGSKVFVFEKSPV